MAGLVDGEGSIYMAKTDSSNRSGKPYTSFCVGITITLTVPADVLDWVVEKFGGAICGSKRGAPGHKDRRKWYVNRAEDVEKILVQILPYLQIKQEQAKLAIGYYAERRKFGHHLGDKGRMMAEAYKAQFHGLNSKGNVGS